MRRSLVARLFPMTRLVGAGLAALMVPASMVSGQTPRDFPHWTAGTLGVQHIATGQSNSTFFVLPDGTTMPLDAGGATPPGRAPIATPRPDGSRPAGEWIARYITRMTPSGRDPETDPAPLTHFHPDHTRLISDGSPPSAHGDYRLAGITDLAERVKIRRILDRAWLDYDYPGPLDNASFANYPRLLEARQRSHRLQVELSVVGRSDQIRLVREPAAHPSVPIRKLHANGDVWTGTGDDTVRIVPPLASVPEEDMPTETHSSLAFLLRYGPFSSYPGGDPPAVPPDGHPAWHDQETPFARGIGGPVDVAVIRHHGSIQPQPRDVFVPGGASCRVFVLDHRTESYRVLAVYGPVPSGLSGPED